LTVLKEKRFLLFSFSAMQRDDGHKERQQHQTARKNYSRNNTRVVQMEASLEGCAYGSERKMKIMFGGEKTMMIMFDLSP
jgi:hypothetical protein